MGDKSYRMEFELRMSEYRLRDLKALKNPTPAQVKEMAVLRRHIWWVRILVLLGF